MAWLPKGNCYAFCETSILAYAPQTSGIYGLYNWDYQIYIGDSSNIRAALLQHLSETDCQPPGYQPTGFAFEACSAELREVKAQRLIAEHQPVRQTEWPSSGWWEAESDGVGQPSYDFASTTMEPGNDDDLSVVAKENLGLSGGKHSYFVRGEVVMLTTMFAISLAVIFFLGFLTGESLQQKANAIYESPLVRFSGGTDVGRPSSEKPSPSDRGSAIAAETPTGNFFLGAPQEPKVEAGVLVRDGTVGTPLAPTRAANTDLSTVNSRGTLVLARTASVPDHTAAWTVQLAAYPQRAPSENQIASLKNRGYKAYIIETGRDGHIWYRVRIGRFATRTEAEALRGMLESREGYRNLFITRD